MQASRYKYLKFVKFRDVVQWDVKRYLDDLNIKFSNSVRLNEVLYSYIEPISKQKMLDNNWSIISKINFSGKLFLREVQEAKTFKGSLYKIDGNTLIYSKINVRHGCIYYHPQDAVPFGVSSEYPAYKFDTKKVLGAFLVKIIQSDYFKNVLNKKTTGISKARVKPTEFLDVKIPLPTLDEQRALVDAYNAKIKAAEEKEQLADKKNKEIEDYLLSELGIEQKKSYSFDYEPHFDIIAEPTIEYGINASRKQNESTTFHWGDEIKKEYQWLKFVRYRDVDRWDCYNAGNKLKSLFGIVRLGKLITSISTGTTPPTSIKTYFDGNVKFYTPADISDEMYLSASERYISDLAIKDNKARVFHRGDILFVGIGSTVGKVGVVNDDIVSSNQQITGFSLKTSLVIPEYVFCFMNYNKHITTAEKTKSTLPIVNQEKIINIPIPLPPLEIQNTIVKHITELKEQIKQLKQESKELRENALVEFEKEIFE